MSVAAETAGVTDSSPAPGRFFQVVSLGHSGTKWLAALLHAPEAGVVCYSELKSHIQEEITLKAMPRFASADRWMINKLELRHPSLLGTMHPGYFQFLERSRRLFETCGDVNSWTPAIAPFACRVMHADDVLLLVRNGISVVNSLYGTLRELPPEHYVFTGYAADAARLMGRELPQAANGPFGQVCAQWLFNAWFSEHFRTVGGQETATFHALRFEDLVDPAAVLEVMALCRKITGGGSLDRARIGAMQARVVNRHMGTSDPAAIWRGWSEAEREIFRAVCGEAMEAFGYVVPEN